METILDCGHPESEHSEFTTGYGTDPETGKKMCYACCAELDKKAMRENGKYTLYLCKNDSGSWDVTNWPGSLRIPVLSIHKGYHNIARTRYDVWFKFEGSVWHGVQYGEWTQICHVKRSK